MNLALLRGWAKCVSLGSAKILPDLLPLVANCVAWGSKIKAALFYSFFPDFPKFRWPQISEKMNQGADVRGFPFGVARLPGALGGDAPLGAGPTTAAAHQPGSRPPRQLPWVAKD